MQTRPFPIEPVRDGIMTKVRPPTVLVEEGGDGTRRDAAALAAAGRSGHGLVVELIGPPGAGKTTLACAAAAEFERRGIPVHLSISARPGEPSSKSGAAPAPRSRGSFAVLSRTAKLLDVLPGMPGATRTDPVADALMRLMPLAPGLRALRRRRYLAGLAQVGPEHELLLQDQGYLCAIAGLALDSGRTGDRALVAALDLAPLPEIAVRVDVPRGIADDRLRRRRRQLGRAERLLERAAADTFRLGEVFDLIEVLLEDRGRSVLRVSGQDQASLEAAVSAMVEAVQAHRTTRRDAKARR